MATATLTTKGQITIPVEVRTSLGLDTGDRVEFVEVAPGRYEFIAATRPVTALKGMFGEPRKAKLIWRPQTINLLDDESGEKAMKLIGALEDNDDVQNVYANFEISDALAQKISG